MDQSIIWGVYTPRIIDGHGALKDFGGSTPLKQLLDMDPSIIWGVYTPRIIDGHGSVNYLGGLHPQNH